MGKINNIDQWVSRTLPQVYTEAMSYQELLAAVMAKLNEVINETNKLLDKDLKVYVEQIISKWHADGTLADIINDEVFSRKADKTYVDGQITNVRTDAPFTRQNISTTTGREWSTNTHDLRYTLNGEALRVLAAPTTEKRKVVIFGSSTAEGFYGSSTNSWWEKLKSVMSSKGWDVLQRSRSGGNTSGGIERFHSDVAAYQPDIVIIAFTLGNEGMTTGMNMDNKHNIKEQFKRNVLRIAAMARQNNIVPVIADQFPTKRYTGGFYQMARVVNKEFDALGLACINLMGAVDALTSDGQPLNLAMHDELHPNDAGHNAMFRAINPSMLEHVAAVPMLERPRPGILYSGVVSTTSAIAPISYIPKTQIDSFTVFFRMKATAPVVAQRTWGAFNSNELRISNQDNASKTIDLRGGGLSAPIISDVGLNDLKDHSVAVTFSALSKFVKLYVDGKLVGTDSSSTLVLDEFTLANRRVNGVLGHSMGYKDFTVYRARLNDQQITDLHNGFVSMSGLDVFCPLGESTELEGRFSNLAPTDEAVEANTNGIYTIQ